MEKNLVKTGREKAREEKPAFAFRADASKGRIEKAEIALHLQKLEQRLRKETGFSHSC